MVTTRQHLTTQGENENRLLILHFNIIITSLFCSKLFDYAENVEKASLRGWKYTFSFKNYHDAKKSKVIVSKVIVWDCKNQASILQLKKKYVLLYNYTEYVNDATFLKFHN